MYKIKQNLILFATNLVYISKTLSNLLENWNKKSIYNILNVTKNKSVVFCKKSYW